MWFPRPIDEGHVMLLEPSGTWTAPAVFALLVDPAGTEWRHKVGVVGAAEGSAKTMTRLLACQGWVLKTRTDQVFASAELALEWSARARADGRAAAIWPPGKLWAVIGAAGGWYPLTVCRELATLRQLPTLGDRCRAWTEMIQAGIDVHRLHGRGLDLNPSNFAWSDERTRLYYLDEELYPTMDALNIAGAMVSRIPEESSASPGDWRSWGRTLRATLSTGALTWDQLANEIRTYPLPAMFEASREALLDGARAAPPAPRASSSRGDITCVLADVHGNLSALDAVLREARAAGVSSYLFLGDAVGYGPQPSRCVQRLAELPGAILVRGNHDHAIGTGRLDRGMNGLARECAEWTRAQLAPDELAWLAALPVERIEPEWLAVHGAPRDPQRFLAYVYELTYEDNLRYLRERKIPLCFYGHTHVQLAHVELAGGPTKLAGERVMALLPRNPCLLNPGSVGQPRDGDPRAAFALWNRSTGTVDARRVAYDVESTVREVHAAGLPSQLERRLRTGT